MLTFDETKHEYRYSGVVVPSVTQILWPCYDFSHVKAAYLETLQQRGTDVHLAVHLEITGQLDESSVDEEIAPYLEQWRKFARDRKLVILSSERMVYSQKYRYAGCLDFEEQTLGVCDIKTSEDLHPAVGLQLSGYTDAMGYPRNAKRHGILLGKDSCKAIPMTDPTDFSHFLGFLSTYNWMRQRNLAKGK